MSGSRPKADTQIDAFLGPFLSALLRRCYSLSPYAGLYCSRGSSSTRRFVRLEASSLSLSGELARGTGFGLLGDILIGIAGASIGALTFPMLHLGLGYGLIPWAIATIGAASLLVIDRLIDWIR